MVIAKGEPWGTEADPPDGLACAESDAATAQLIERSRGPVIRLGSGDLVRTLGGPRSASSGTTWFPMDCGWLSIDGGVEMAFVAHVVARRRWWRGEGAVVMNAAWLGELYLGPRAHPNDGLLDVTYGSLPIRQRPQARQRARHGTHLPHPGLQSRRVAAWDHTFSSSIDVFVDGVRRGRGRSIAVRVEPDSFTVVH